MTTATRTTASQVANLQGVLDTLGFAVMNSRSCRDLGNVRVWLSPADDRWEVMAFVGRPGWSPVKYELSLTMVMPESVIAAAITAVVESEVR